MNAPDAEIVPFGKYKGRPIVDLVADRSYVDWLAAQPWFREKYGNVYNIIIGANNQPQDTPEHNIFQARFLDHNECLRLCRPWLKDASTLRSSWNKYCLKLAEAQQRNLSASDHHKTTLTSLAFEYCNWDLFIGAGSSLEIHESNAPTCTCTCDNKYHIRGGYRNEHCSPDCTVEWKHDSVYQDAINGIGSQVRIAVELKPILGDDYPTVLREVVKRYEINFRTVQPTAIVVLANHAEFTGLDFKSVQQIFSTRGITLLRTIDLPDLDPEWHCSCDKCTQ